MQKLSIVLDVNILAQELENSGIEPETSCMLSTRSAN